MAEDLENLWGKLSLSEVENTEVEFLEEESSMIANKGNHYIDEKLMTDRFVGKDTIRFCLVWRWRLTGSMGLKVLGKNTFLF